MEEVVKQSLDFEQERIKNVDITEPRELMEFILKAESSALRKDHFEEFRNSINKKFVRYMLDDDNKAYYQKVIDIA